MILLTLLLQIILIFFPITSTINIEESSDLIVFFETETDLAYIEEMALKLENTYPNIQTEIITAEEAYIEYYHYAETNGLDEILETMDKQTDKKLPPTLDIMEVKKSEEQDLIDFITALDYQAEIKEIASDGDMVP